MRRRNIPHRKISIHALCEEGDSFSFSNRPVFSSFLSTPSARRATDVRAGLFCSYGRFLSTPSARRATPKWLHLAAHAKISIHALCEEGDVITTSTGGSPRLFLSTPSARRATHARGQRPRRGMISIHALCEEGDLVGRNLVADLVVISIHALCEEGDMLQPLDHLIRENFYPRPLRGGRQAREVHPAGPVIFLSTPSARRATRWHRCAWVR